MKLTMKLIGNAILETLRAGTPARSLIEGMMKYDFKIGARRGHLMQLCFSNLAAWPLVIIILLLALVQFPASWSLVSRLGYDSPVVLFLLDGKMQSMLIVFSALFFLEWIFRKEYILLAILFYFLKRGELHIHLAAVAVLAVYLARICYLWWLSVDCESDTKKIWKTACVLQAMAWLVSAFCVLNVLDYLQVNFLFGEQSYFSRFNFLAASVLLYHILSHLFLGLWGHLSFKSDPEPSHLPTYYSTAQWILRFSMGRGFRQKLQELVTARLAAHQDSQNNLSDLKLQSPGLAKLPVEDVLRKEIEYLKEANLRLTKM